MDIILPAFIFNNSIKGARYWIERQTDVGVPWQIQLGYIWKRNPSTSGSPVCVSLQNNPLHYHVLIITL